MDPLPSPSLGIKGAVTTVPEQIAPRIRLRRREVIWTAAVSPGKVTLTWVSLGETEEKTKGRDQRQKREKSRRRDRRTDAEGEKENSLLKTLLCKGLSTKPVFLRDGEKEKWEKRQKLCSYVAEKRESGETTETVPT